jgi:hypothetical protein
MLLIKLVDRIECLMEFSTLEDIEEMTVKLAYCSMKSRSGKQLLLSIIVVILINSLID